MIAASESTRREAQALPSEGEAVVLDGRYRLVRQLGAGGMGEVWEARHLVLGCRVAVKLLHTGSALALALKQFRREASALASLESDHVVAVFDFCEQDRERPYMVMELLVGSDLRRLLDAEKKLAPVRAARMAIQICHALMAAHARAIIHRDLKPSNVFVCSRWDGSDHVKVLDFGVAKLGREQDPSTLSGRGGLVGTLSYMAPEQARGTGSIDHRVDVYALGAVLYEALSGHQLHEGVQQHAVLQHIIYEQPIPLQTRCPDLPCELSVIVAKALAKDPEHRYQSAVEFADALSRFVTDASGTQAGVRRVPVAGTKRARWVVALAMLAAGVAGGALDRITRVTREPAPVRVGPRERETQVSTGSVARTENVPSTLPSSVAPPVVASVRRPAPPAPRAKPPDSAVFDLANPYQKF